MAEHFVVLLDVISFISFLLAFFVLFRVPRKKIGRSTRAFLQAALFIYIFVSFSNFLEHSGITAVLDPYEDYFEVIFPLLFLFFVYSAMLRHEVGLRLISEQQLLQAIGTLEERFRLFIENTPAVGFIEDVDGHHLFANRKFRELLGPLAGHSGPPPWPRKILSEILAHNRVVLEKGLWEGVERVPDKEGRIRVFQVSKFRIPQDNGTFLVGGVALDITEAHELRDERHRLATILEQLGEGIIVTDSDGTIQFVNEVYESRTGYSRKELLGQNPRILKSGEHDQAFYKALWDTIKGGNTWQGHIINRNKNGELFHEQATIFPVKDEGGHIIQFAAIKRDISREMELEAVLRQSQKLETIGQLVGGIAHDFNNILTAINGYSELAMKEQDPGSRGLKYLEKVRDAGERASELTKKLLGFGRKQMIQPKVLDLSQTIREFESIAKRLIGEDIELVLNLKENLSPVFADPSQIDQVLMNLLVNARDAIHENRESGARKIVVETSETYLDEAYVKKHIGASVGPHILLNVTDTGVGIPREIQLKIFEPFFTTKKVGTGTGLGLATILGIVKQNNGSVFVYSEVGQGATFKIYWPIYKADTIVSGLRSRFSETNHIVKGSGTILLVEDEADVREFARDVLENSGYTVLEAASGESAMELLEHYEGPLDLLFTDIVMPGMSGIELAGKLHRIHPDLKKLYASGYSEEVLEQKGIHGVNSALLMKPYSRGELTRRIHNLLKKNNK